MISWNVHVHLKCLKRNANFDILSLILPQPKELVKKLILFNTISHQRTQKYELTRL